MTRALLLALVFLHGAFAAGMVPVLNHHLGPLAPRAFALYFGGMVAAQGALWLVAALSRPRAALGLYELLFAGAIVTMAVTLTPGGFLAGRLVEGVGSGLTLPLIFAATLRLEGWGPPERRIALMNSSFALGFVSGPFAVEAARAVASSTAILLAFALAFTACAAGALALLPPAPPPAAAATLRGGLARFWPLCAAKLAYGFTLALLSGHAHVLFPGRPLSLVMLGLALTFVLGQVVASRAVRRVGVGGLLRVGALLLAATTGALAATGRGELVLATSLAHSALILAGYRALSADRGDVRTFALWNAATDPALLAGALLAWAGTDGAWGLCVLGVFALGLPLPEEPA